MRSSPFSAWRGLLCIGLRLKDPWSRLYVDLKSTLRRVPRNHHKPQKLQKSDCWANQVDVAGGGIKAKILDPYLHSRPSGMLVDGWKMGRSWRCSSFQDFQDLDCMWFYMILLQLLPIIRWGRYGKMLSVVFCFVPSPGGSELKLPLAQKRNLKRPERVQ